MATTLDAVLALADQLSPRDQARLIEHLSRQIAPALAETVATPSGVVEQDVLAKLAQLGTELAAHPSARLASEQLRLDRAERQAALEGTGRVYA